MSVEKRLEAMGDETELNLDGINKPDLSKISADCAQNLTELSLNLCQLSDLDSLPSLPALYKLQLNDNKISDIKSIPEKCPSLLELTLSGNKKISSIDQLKPISTLKSLLKIDVEGCAISEKENYRKELFDLCATLAEVDGFDAQGNEVDDDDEEEEDEAEESEEEGDSSQPGLSALYGELGSDEDDDDYNSNEEPEGSDGEDDLEDLVPEQPENQFNDEGAGPSGSSSSAGPPPKRAKIVAPDSDSD